MKNFFKIAFAVAVIAMVSWSCKKGPHEPHEPIIEILNPGHYTFDGVKTDLTAAYYEFVPELDNNNGAYLLFFTTEAWENSRLDPKEYIYAYIPISKMGQHIALKPEMTPEPSWDFSFSKDDVTFWGHGMETNHIVGGTYNATISGNRVIFNGNIAITADDGKSFKTLEINYEGQLSAIPPFKRTELPAFDETLNNQWKFDGTVVNLTEGYFINYGYGSQEGYFILSDDVVTLDRWNNASQSGTENILGLWYNVSEWEDKDIVPASESWEVYFYADGNINHGGFEFWGSILGDIDNMLYKVTYVDGTMNVKANILFNDGTNLQAKYSGVAKTDWEGGVPATPNAAPKALKKQAKTTNYYTITARK